MQLFLLASVIALGFLVYKLAKQGGQLKTAEAKLSAAKAELVSIEKHVSEDYSITKKELTAVELNAKNVVLDIVHAIKVKL